MNSVLHSTTIVRSGTTSVSSTRSTTIHEPGPHRSAEPERPTGAHGTRTTGPHEIRATPPTQQIPTTPIHPIRAKPEQMTTGILKSETAAELENPGPAHQIRNDQLTNDGNGAREQLAPVIYMAGASLPNVRHWAGEGALRAPFDPPASRAPGGLAAERWAWPTLVPGDAPMADRRIVRASVRASAAEFAAWKAKAAATGVPLSDLLRPAVAPQVTIRAQPERRWRAARSSLSAHRLRS